MAIFAAAAFVGVGYGQQSCVTGDGGRGQCRPLVKCVRFMHEVAELERRPCRLLDGEQGVCCPHIVIGTATCKSSYFTV